MIRFILFLLVFSGLTTRAVSNAQSTYFEPFQDIKVMRNHRFLSFPWGGGLNAPQFSNLDINGDGLSDLFVFDRASNHSSFFINRSTSDSIVYEFLANPLFSFPSAERWALLIDYDLDGFEDLFTFSPLGVLCYRNKGLNGTFFGFETTPILLKTQYGSFNAGLYVSPADLPAFYDLDLDGDLDVLTFSAFGACVEWHRNMSVETYGHSDSLIFSLSTSSWGKFREGNSLMDISFPDSCAEISGQVYKSPRHSGATLCVNDFNGDGLPDLVMGEIDFPYLVYLENGGSLDTARITQVFLPFPENFGSSQGVFIENFPAGFHVRVGLNQKSFIVAPNQNENSEDRHAVWLYNNLSDSGVANYQLVRTAFIQSDMIDVGTGSGPVFVHLTNPNSPDLSISNQDSYSFGSGISLYQYISGATGSYYLLVDEDLAGTRSHATPGRNHTFEDLNGDGLLDIIWVDISGKPFVQFNMGNSSPVPEFSEKSSIGMPQSIGANSSPVMWDWNKDGLSDLLVGTMSGTLSLYFNKGSEGNHYFDNQPDLIHLGGVNVSHPEISPFGYASPLLIENDGQPFLLVGNLKGEISIYGDLLSPSGSINAHFSLISAQAIGDAIPFSKPAAVNLPSGRVWLLTGNSSGGIQSYQSNSPLSLSQANHSIPAPYPNPTNGLLTWELPELNLSSVALYDLAGRAARIIVQENVLFVGDNPEGVYVLTGKDFHGHLLSSLLIIQK